MKRIISMSLLTILTAVLLSGCLQINISIGVDERYNAYLRYNITMDVSDVDAEHHELLAKTLNNWGFYYQEEHGFTVGVETDTEIYVLTMSKTVANNSLEEAYKSLEMMLTDEDITPFVQTDMKFYNNPGMDSYITGATLDIPHILSRSEMEHLPQDIHDAIAGGVETSSGSIELTLPVSEVIKNTHDIEIINRYAVMQIPISYDEPTEFEMRANVVYSSDGIQIGTVDETIEELEQTKKTIYIVCAATLTLLLIILIATLIKIYRHNRLL